MIAPGLIDTDMTRDLPAEYTETAVKQAIQAGVDREYFGYERRNGSVEKALTFASLLDAGKVTPETRFKVPGRLDRPRRVHGTGPLSRGRHGGRRGRAGSCWGTGVSLIDVLTTRSRADGRARPSGRCPGSGA